MKNIYKIKANKDYTDLDNSVVKIINDKLDKKNKYDLKAFINDLQQCGCQSGFINELIYYSDTEAFYKKHSDSIQDLIADSLDDGLLDGETLAKWFKSNFENYAAWFAFEVIADKIAMNLLDGEF